MADGLEKELRATLGPLADLLEVKAQAVVKAAKREWPVKSGESRDAWKVQLLVNTNHMTIEATAVNDSGYAQFINSAKVGKDTPSIKRYRKPIDTLIRQPMKRARRELRVEAPEVFVKHLQGAING